METVKQFLEILFRDLNNEYIEIRLISNEGRAQSIFYESIEDVLIDFEAINTQEWNCYFGVCPRKEKSGTKASVSRVQTLWVDLDAKHFLGGKEEALQQLQRISLAPTIVIDSGHGYHAYWKLKTSLNNQDAESYLKTFAQILRADLAVAETAHLLRLPNTFNVKDETAPIIAQIISMHPSHEYEITDLAEFDRQKVLIPEIIQREESEPILEGERNSSLTRIAGSLRKLGLSEEEILESLSKINEKRCKPPLKQEEVKRISKSIARYSNNDKSEVDKTIEMSAGFEGLVDLVQENNEIKFLIKHDGKLIVTKEWETGKKFYIPPPAEAIDWLLPRAEEVLRHYESDNNKKLYEDLLVYHKNISELPKEEFYDLLVAWDFHTYALESFKHTPYLYLFAVADRGKSRTGQGVAYVAYRGYWTESINEAQLIRLANDCKATIFLDVMNLWKDAERRSIQDILLGRFEKGSRISRVKYPDKGPFLDMVHYKIFGPTILATNVKVHEILETRAIEINMPESDKVFGDPVEPSLSLPLKERLVAFRARLLNQNLPPVDKPLKSRLGDILRPLFQIVNFVYPEKEPIFLRLAEAIEAGRKLDRSTTSEADLLKAVIKNKSSVEKGLLLTSHILETFNLNKTDRFKVTSNRVGRDLVALGFEKKNAPNGNVAIVYDEKKINILKARYGLKISETAESSEKETGSEISDDSDNSQDVEA